jgi:hypothetical protein
MYTGPHPEAPNSTMLSHFPVISLEIGAGCNSLALSTIHNQTSNHPTSEYVQLSP